MQAEPGTAVASGWTSGDLVEAYERGFPMDLRIEEPQSAGNAISAARPNKKLKVKNQGRA